ncbi:histidine kinase [Mesorhizobium tianshanense]|uniref:Blue-light-activated histidine kinase n=1 Tax=Mesorhizobium tianshanense TaxID=39844 RepID=A0A562N7C8_9HYPH|nr:PAS domain S-box protein [Mesorhizobium tianshanense]TWI28023.1 PAS domain S-box-containing protein [Mesorhizobium tianshanense]GLS39720.1 histidine kinase [Mesorhizobium tianshanense]
MDFVQQADIGLGDPGVPSADLLQSLPVAIYTVDKQGRITYFNEAAAEMWGRRPVIGQDQWCGSWKLRQLDGRPMAHGECPMAVALREGRDVSWDQAIAERPDGELVPFRAHPRLLRDGAGNVIGAINTLLDLRTQTLGDEARMRLAAIVESSMDAIVSKDMNGIITSWNDAAERLFGYTPAEAIGRPVTILIPPDRLDEEASIISRIRIGERVPSYETMRLRKDGTLVPVSLTISPIRDAIGRAVGASKIARDISSHKESERRIRLLMREVNHRVKNQYSVIISMIRETSKLTSTPEAFLDQVRERITALSESHDLLVNADWRGATVGDLAQAQLKAFAAQPLVSMAGPMVLLQPNAVQYLGIAFHELATNSAKYGALCCGGGRVEIDWDVVPAGDGADIFRLVWRELGGPILDAVRRRGFGSVVLERVAPQALSGSGRLEFHEQGVTWTLEAPLYFVQASMTDIAVD